MRTVHRAIPLASILPVCLLAMTAATHFSQAQSSTASTPKVSAAISFRCLWWSEEQKNGLNPNSPPPKNTEVTIHKWEYSDPIEVPHPDVVDVVVDLRNETGLAANNLVVHVSAIWKVGPLRNRARASWGKAVSLRRFAAVNLDARGSQTLRVPVNLVEKMNRLAATRSWPWALRAQITISSASGKLLRRTTADLPIIPGD